MERISIDPQIKKKVFQKFHGRCFYCGRQLTWAETTIDHVVPLAKGGTNNVDNFVTACCECNVLKGDKSVEDFKIFMYSLMANALRYINSNLYNTETGELEFFGERNSDAFGEISKEDAFHLNNMMKPQATQFKKYITKKPSATTVNQRLSMEDIKSIPIDNPYDTPGPIDTKPFEDDEWENSNSLVEKPFVALVGESKPILLPEKEPEEVIEETKTEEDNIPNFIMIEEKEEPIIIKKVEFNIPKGLSMEAKNFLKEIKRLIEEENISSDEDSIRVYYNRMDKKLISDRQYVKISKELIRKDIINKHKKFRPRAITISKIVL